MTTISLTYNERNIMAQKAIDYILSLGLFKTDTKSSGRAKTLEAIADAKAGRNITICHTWDEYLEAVR